MGKEMDKKGKGEGKRRGGKGKEKGEKGMEGRKREWICRTNVKLLPTRLVTTKSIETVKYCQEYFGSEMDVGPLFFT